MTQAGACSPPIREELSCHGSIFYIRKYQCSIWEETGGFLARRLRRGSLKESLDCAREAISTRDKGVVSQPGCFRGRSARPGLASGLAGFTRVDPAPAALIRGSGLCPHPGEGPQSRAKQMPPRQLHGLGAPTAGAEPASIPPFPWPTSRLHGNCPFHGAEMHTKAWLRASRSSQDLPASPGSAPRPPAPYLRLRLHLALRLHQLLVDLLQAGGSDLGGPEQGSEGAGGPDSLAGVGGGTGQGLPAAPL